MTARNDRFDRVFADVLADLALPTYPDYIDDALDIATRKRQRPAWAFPERWLPMTSMTRATPFLPGLPMRRLVLVAIVALLAAAIAIAAIGSLRQPAPPFGPAGNGVIAYEIDGDLFTRDVVTGAVQTVASSADTEVFPSFSRDGRSLAYFVIDPASQGTASEQATVMVADADGSDPRAVTSVGLVQWAAWAPDSSGLAVLETVASRDRLSIIGLDGSVRELPIDVDIDAWMDWRPPDGRELIFRGSERGSVGFFALSVESGQTRRLTPRTTSVRLGGTITLTPDGKQLMFMNMGDVFDIRTLDIGSGDVQVFGARLPVPEGGAGSGPMHYGSQQLSPDGSRIVFGRYWDEDFSAAEINEQVWVASVAGDGSDAIPISPVIRAASGRDPFNIALSPDGTQIIVHQVDTNQTWLTDWSGANRQDVDWGSFYDSTWQRMAR